MADKTHNTDSFSSNVQVHGKASNSLFLTVSSPIEVNNNILVLVPEISRTLRDTPPAHHTLKIESFSQLSSLLRDDKIDKYESHDFVILIWCNDSGRLCYILKEIQVAIICHSL